MVDQLPGPELVTKDDIEDAGLGWLERAKYAVNNRVWWAKHHDQHQKGGSDAIDVGTLPGHLHRINDDDNDTYVDTEVTADSDIIEFASAGTILARIRNSVPGFQLANSADLEMYSDAFSTKVVTIDGATGHMTIGTGSPGATTQLLLSHTITDPASGVTGLNTTAGLVFTGTSTFNSTVNFGSFSSAITGPGSAKTMSGIVKGINVQPLLSNGGFLTVNDFRGYFSSLTIGTDNTVVNRYGLYVAAPTVNGALTNQYGVYIENMNGAGTINRAIHSLGGISTHLGAMRFGSNTAPTNVTDGDLTVARLKVVDGAFGTGVEFSVTGDGALSGFLRAGSETAPTNTTAGDLTATRLIVPNATILHSAISQLGGPVVIPTNGAVLFSDSDNSNYVGIRSPGTAQSENYIYELPDDDPSNGQVLAVKSTAASPVITTEWIAAGAGGSNALLDGSTHTDTTNSAVTRGDLIIGNSTPAWDDLAIGAANSVLKSDGTDPAWAVAIPKAREYIRAEMLHPSITRTNPAPPPQTNDSGSNDIVYRAIPFDGATEEYASYNFLMPSNYDAGTFTAKFIWTALSGSGDVIWGARLMAARNDDAINTAMGTAVTVTDTVLSTGDAHISAATSAITAGGTPAAGCMMFVEVYRDGDAAGDTLNSVDALLLGVELVYGISGATLA